MAVYAVMAAAVAATPPPAVFIHAWARNKAEAPATSAIIAELIEGINPAWPIRVTVVGAAKWPNASFHAASGMETVTLERIKLFCGDNPARTVVYLHTKGAFHPSASNSRRRAKVKRAAVSPACMRMTGLDSACNVCGQRISLTPYHYPPGNMWAAQCSHINRLVSPTTWKRISTYAYTEPRMMFSKLPDWCMGAHRYADETWVLSRPGSLGCSPTEPLNAIPDARCSALAADGRRRISSLAYPRPPAADARHTTFFEYPF